MITFAARRFREFLAGGLLGVAALYVISGISLLFKDSDDIFFGFAGRSAGVSHLFMHPVVVFALVAAVVLVVVWGESPHARPIVLAAIAIGAVALVFGLVSWLAGLTADEADALPAYGGVLGAGKVVGVLLGLAQLVFLGLAVFFSAAVFASLPRPVRLTQEQWGQLYGAPPGWPQGGQPGAQQQQPAAGWQPDPGGWAQSSQQGWGQQGPGWGGAAASPAHGADQQAMAEPGGTLPAEPVGTWTASAAEPVADDDSVRAAHYEVGEPALASPEPEPFGAEVGAHVGEEPVADQPTGAGEEPSPAVDEGRDEASDGNDSSGWWRPSSS